MYCNWYNFGVSDTFDHKLKVQWLKVKVNGFFSEKTEFKFSLKYIFPIIYLMQILPKSLFLDFSFKQEEKHSAGHFRKFSEFMVF